ncbi:MAG: phosphotransferase [Verrucomicrobiales bacterium]|nr:phosphotransferase [Verrucomicrobiales bacterium]
MIPPRLELPLRAAVETLRQHGLESDRCEILQDGHTLVVRLAADLVARIVTDREGPRQGTEWFARENAVARHLALHGAPVIPLHPQVPPGPHEHLGYTMSFWVFVTEVETEPDPTEIGTTLRRCHEILATFPGELPDLKILHESIALLETPSVVAAFDEPTRRMLRSHLEETAGILRTFPKQALHGDAHYGNLMQTTTGLLWTDWEDAFSVTVNKLAPWSRCA